jgi:hypothetical protein
MRRIVSAATWVLLVGGCREPATPSRADQPRQPPVNAADASPRSDIEEHDDLAAAVASLIQPDTRVLGFGELHARTDRPASTAPSVLSRFTTEILPSLAPRVSDLVIETWQIDSSCGAVAAKATESLRAATRRPATTPGELETLVTAATRLHIPRHGMRVTCQDYRALSAGDDDAIIHMMDLTTSELTRIVKGLLRRPVGSQRLILVYGGALHNDRSPAPGLATWSYAGAVDAASDRGFLEIDLIAPDLARSDPATAAQPWAALLGSSRRVVTFHRGERSHVIILPSSVAP